MTHGTGEDEHPGIGMCRNQGNSENVGRGSTRAVSLGLAWPSKWFSYDFLYLCAFLFKIQIREGLSLSGLGRFIIVSVKVVAYSHFISTFTKA